MAIFKVGDRVRHYRTKQVGAIVEFRFVPKGAVGKGGVIYPFDSDCAVQWDDQPEALGQHTRQLEPLTPPGQKEFKAEDILHLPNLPDFKTMTPEFARAWGGA